MSAPPQAVAEAAAGSNCQPARHARWRMLRRFGIAVCLDAQQDAADNAGDHGECGKQLPPPHFRQCRKRQQSH